MITMKLLVCVVSVMLILEGFQIKCCLQNERVGLLQIKSYFSSFSNISKYESYDLSSWSVGNNKSDCCEWERVKCSPSTGRVTHLFLGETTWSQKSWPLDMTLFHPFQELKTLQLFNNSIGSFVQSEGLVMSKNFQELDLHQNSNISYLPDFIWNLSSLRILDSSHTSVIGELDVRLCKLKNIRELYFHYTQLSGSLPSCLWNLTALQILDLSYSSFSGILPSSINLPSLEMLSIESNNFGGKFSLSSLNNHSSLEGLILSDNALQVEIDESLVPSTMRLQALAVAHCNLSMQTKTFQKFSSFRLIDLSDTGLIGSFPTWLLQNNSHLKYLHLRNNLLTGGLHLPQKNYSSLFLLDISSNQFGAKIPHHIGSTLPAINLLQMSDNSFVGLIPSSIGNMTQLYILDLSNNQLVGEVPERLLSSFPLMFLVLSNNYLEGEIIPNNMNLPWLYVLSLDNNNFDGTIKESLKKSTYLKYLNIGRNLVSGELPYWIENLGNLEVMSLERNQIHGSIPSRICILGLYYLDISENKLVGEIPPCGLDSPLVYLNLYGNSLTGEIPYGLSRSLRILNLESNHLSGGIPSWINVFSDLRFLLLGHNRLQGELPIQLCQLQKLNILSLTNNSLSGVIPSCMQNLSLGLSEINYHIGRGYGIPYPITPNFKFKDRYSIRKYNVYKYSVILNHIDFIVKSRDVSYGGIILFIISALDLSCNQFTGGIHPDLGELTKLNTINFSHNYLSGPIPQSFSNLKSAESLDLSFNKLSGTIPSQLENLNFLEVFNVSFNNLSGEVPETGQFGSFDERNYLGNPLLCGSNLLKSCIVEEPPCSSSTEYPDEGDATFDLGVFFWSFGLSYIMVLLTLFLALYINSEWRRAWFVFIDLHLLLWLYK